MRSSLLAVIPFAVAFFLLAIFFKPIAKVWLGTELDYAAGLIPCMALYYVLYLVGSVLSSISNGLGRTKVQLVTGFAGAAVNIPLSVFLCTAGELDVTGVLVATVVAMLASNVAVFVDLARYLNQCNSLDNG